MLAPPQQAMEMEHGVGTSTQSTTKSGSLAGSSDPVVEGLISIASTSSSSSSSSGSFDLLLELNSAKDDGNEGPTPELEQATPGSPKLGPIEDSIQANDLNPYGSFVKQSPPVQTMGRPNNSGYDPNRIPSSVFASKPASPMDWSVASNESLFSIHMGNNSFSRDHAILMMGKSGELYKFDDLISSVPTPQPKTNEMINPPYNLPTVVERSSDVDNYRQSVSTEQEGLSMRKEADITPKAGMKATLEDHHNEIPLSYNSSNISDGRETPTRTSGSNPRFSSESGTNSSSSFAFPLLSGEVGSHRKVKVASENVQPRPIEKPMTEIEPKVEPHRPTLRPAGTRWFSWFRFRPVSCSLSFPRRCFFCC